MNLLPESELQSMALSEYQGFLKQNPAVTGTSDAQMVKNIGAKIQVAVVQYMNQNKLGKRISNYKWEFNYLPILILAF